MRKTLDRASDPCECAQVFKSRGTYVVHDSRIGRDVGSAATLAEAKDLVRDTMIVRVRRWKREEVDGVTTWYSDGDCRIRLVPDDFP